MNRVAFPRGEHVHTREMGAKWESSSYTARVIGKEDSSLYHGNR